MSEKVANVMSAIAVERELRSDTGRTMVTPRYGRDFFKYRHPSGGTVRQME
jgi:hypothetical protein